MYSEGSKIRLFILLFLFYNYNKEVRKACIEQIKKRVICPSVMRLVSNLEARRWKLEYPVSINKPPCGQAGIRVSTTINDFQ